MNRQPCVPCAEKLVIWHANNSILRGWTFQANRINTAEYNVNAINGMIEIIVTSWEMIESTTGNIVKINLPRVILPLIISGFFRISANAAIGMPQFATGPQKCVLNKINRNVNFYF